MEIQDIDLRQLIETETGERFSNQGYICCPFHKEKTPSLSVKFFPDRNKQRFMCWGCTEQGDALDFIMKYRNLDYKAARKYLGMENKKSENQLQEEIIREYITWQIEKTEHKKGYKLLGLFPFTDENNKVIYYKAKLLRSDGTKETPYYHIEGNKVINKRGAEEVPYNLSKVISGINQQKTIIFVEGEKDANTVNSVLRGMNFVATSIKGCKDLSILKNRGPMSIYVIGDTGRAGEQYKLHIYDEFISEAREFKFINLPGLKSLGDNKDVTDWIEDGHAKEELLMALERSLDLKNQRDLQQDSKGIYRVYWDKKQEDYIRLYITDFQLLEAKRITFVDDETEGITMVFKSCTGGIIERTGLATVFDDIKSFKNFLGTLDLSFRSTDIKDLTELKSWVNKYWALENDEIYSGSKFIRKDNQLMLITKDGTITANGVNSRVRADKSGYVDLICKELISKEELNELRGKLFKFATFDKTITIIGTVLNNLAVVQNEEAKEKLHHLLLVGESGSGKSTILSNVIAAVLNYPAADIKSIGLITTFALIKDLSDGNYPIIFDEFKPSALDKNKVQKLSEAFRNLYDRTTVSRGDKTLKTRGFRFTSPIIVAGEESYPNGEKALVERSAIVYLSKGQRTSEHTIAMEWIKSNENILNKFGRSIIDVILNLSVDSYKNIRTMVSEFFPELNNRPLATAVNIATGMEILNLLLVKHGFPKILGYEKYIKQNIGEEILDGDNEAKSTVEQMLVLYNNMIEDGRAYDYKNVVIDRADGLFIRTSEMLNQIHMFVNQVGAAEVIPLKLRDFKKQAEKSGYFTKTAAKQIKIDRKPVRFDEYNKEKMRQLQMYSIVKPTEIEEYDY
ncbi:CHC2 zinc finger domain-containing protein [Clostridium cellulovorans]|uniref:Sigma 54 interacting domain protein n=1 Tax=Clostridium cellulovorans (strain ATCC 35296 / DSM 3052 / OCM 3 / 743B) TaxID=573061 RepID=D9SNT5_CLOC7|nr:CHC2 zinc finger domain-containing protein [Clostridium cellulovorans]ADL49956.1 Sigma 54 interacting domain protein [Clostridium cellulovorans 743B]